MRQLTLYKQWRETHPKEYKKYRKRWLADHPESNKKYSKRWHAAHPGYNKRWLSAHPGYSTKFSRRWRAEHPERHKKWYLASRYDLTVRQFEALLKACHGACQICRKPFATAPRIDHDHKTKRVRGLLCNYCNVRLGFIESKLYGAALRYLKRANSR